MKFVRFYNRGRFHLKKNHRIRAKAYRIVLKLLFQCEIPLEAKIDKDVFFCHNAFGVVINPNAVISGGTTIQHSVTIGELETHEAPVIGANVFIGARAMILGPVSIGNNARIGAGAVVLCDVPDNCTAVGVPARIVKKG